VPIFIEKVDHLGYINTSMKIIYVIFFIMLTVPIWGQQDGLFHIGRVKYAGGGDWYNDPTEEVNLLNYVKAHTNVKVKAEYKFVDIASDEIFAYPFLFLTGHGNIVFSDDEIVRLRKYLEGGGFLYIDDDYGLDKFIRREMKRVYPDKDFIELPFSHKLYHVVYDFPAGPPKTHEHDGKRPQGFGIFIDKRLAVYYTYESNPSDGWDDPEVHGDPPEKREEALRFGTNLVIYALSN
jgi:hypothetical protein